jgi:putative NADPH-quinone reductase
MGKKILILDGHPDGRSLCASLAERYVAGAIEAGHEVKRLNVRDLVFDPILHFGYRSPQDLEPDLLEAQALIRACEHLVIVTPLWWAGIPALFKAFIDRTFVRGFSHAFNPAKGIPEKLLKGRSATVIYTQGAPYFYSRLFVGDAFWKMIKRGVLSFSGFAPVSRICFSKIKPAQPHAGYAKILDQAFILGRHGK